MWLLPATPASGRSRKVAVPPAPCILFTACTQPSRRLSPLTPHAPTLLSPHTETNGTLGKNFSASSAVSVSQPPSTLTSPFTRLGRLRTTSRPYTPDCECTKTTAGPILSRSAASALTVVARPPFGGLSEFGTSWDRYWSIASSGNCTPGNGLGYSGPKRKLAQERSIGPRKKVGSPFGSAPPSRTAFTGVGLKPERPRPEWSTTYTGWPWRTNQVAQPSRPSGVVS